MVTAYGLTSKATLRVKTKSKEYILMEKKMSKTPRSQEFLNGILGSFVQGQTNLNEKGEYIPLSDSEVIACCNVILMLDGAKSKQDILASLAMCLDDESYKKIYLTLGESFIERSIGPVQ